MQPMSFTKISLIVIWLLTMLLLILFGMGSYDSYNNKSDYQDSYLGNLNWDDEHESELNGYLIKTILYFLSAFLLFVSAFFYNDNIDELIGEEDYRIEQEKIQEMKTSYTSSGGETEAYVGSTLLIIGTFLPLISLEIPEILGGGDLTIAYMDTSGYHDGYVIIVCALISFFLINSDLYGGLLITGLIPLIMMVKLFLDIDNTEGLKIELGVYTIALGSLITMGCGIAYSGESVQTPLEVNTGSSNIIKKSDVKPLIFKSKSELIAIECPGCESQMKVPKLNELQEVTCKECGLSGEIEV